MSRLKQPRVFTVRYAVVVVVAVVAIAFGSGVTAAWMAAKPQSLATAKPLAQVPVTKTPHFTTEKRRSRSEGQSCWQPVWQAYSVRLSLPH